jgi:hypothetical protein
MTRLEGEVGRLQLNTRAGYEIAEYIRGRGLQQIPILFFDIHTFNAVKGQDFVTRFEPAGYTGGFDVIKEYISSMQSGNDRRAWASVRYF